MITGVRLTQLGYGEPLIGNAWSYRNLTGIEAVEKRLEDLFYTAQNLGFNFIIDTIRPQLDVNGILNLNNNGLYGDVWSFDRRIELYQVYSNKAKLNLLLEVEFPTAITENNLTTYANYFIDLVDQYPWVKYWEVMVAPEQIVDGNYKCTPENYVQFLKYVYPQLKIKHADIKIGGPGIYQALIDYAELKPNNWLAAAMGEIYDSGDPLFQLIGDKGFLPFVDFFSIQAKQNTEGLKYEKFPIIIDTLNTAIKQKLSKNLPIYSIAQGWQAAEGNQTDLQEQGYYETREILNCIKKGVIPFKMQLVDEFPSPLVDPSKLNYGLLYYYLGENGLKPAFNDYYFLLKNLKDFSTITVSTNIIESNPDVDILTLMNNTQDQLATIVWMKNFSSTSIVVQPHYSRHYLLPNGEQGTLANPTQIILNTNQKFVIIYQNISQNIIDIDRLESTIERKLNYTEETLTNLVGLLPNSYNKEIRDTNYYKLLRAFALELSDAKIEIEEIKDDLYLDSAKDDAIYNNFGVLVNLSKRPEWDYEKYRRLVKGVTQSLLKGPTPESITDAVKLFTNFDVSIYELYKTYENMDKSMLENINPQFAFVVEIEKPVDAAADQNAILRDTNYIINIIKPAHTIHLIIITLAGKENYKDSYKTKYGIDFKDSDNYMQTIEQTENEGTFGWKHFNYEGQFTTNHSQTNSGMFIGPRYVLYDNETTSMVSNNEAEYKDVLEYVNNILDYDVRDKYDGAEDKNWSELEQGFNEYKFGFDHNGLIRYNLKTLNNYKLAPGSKLDDEDSYNFQQFLEDKYVFRNTLKSLRFNKPHIIGIHGLNNKFSENPDKAVIFDFSQKEKEFKKKVIKLSDGSLIDIDRLQEDNEPDVELKEKITIKDSELTDINIDTNEIKDIKQSEEKYENELALIDELEDISEEIIEFFDYSLYDQIPEYLENISASFDKGYKDFYDLKKVFVNLGADYEVKDQYIKGEDNYLYSSELDNEEKYRNRELGDIIYHVHKKIIAFVDRERAKVLLPERDLYLKENEDFESLARVFVNGILQPSWNYTEIPSVLDETRACGIIFKDGVVFPGDIVNILYLKDREVVVGQFPIMEEFPTEIIFGTKEETWRTVENINDEMIVNYIHDDIYKKAQDQFISSNILIAYDDKYKVVKDTPCFEGSEYTEISLWNKTVNRNHRMTLNMTPLNSSILFGFSQEKVYIDAILFEKLTTLKEDLLPLEITDEFKDKISEIFGDYEFGSYFQEDNIKVSLTELNDYTSEFGIEQNDNYFTKNDSVQINSMITTYYDKYDFKEDRIYADYIMGEYLDIRTKEIFDKNSFGMDYDDVSNIAIDDIFTNTFSSFKSEKYIYTDEKINSHYEKNMNDNVDLQKVITECNSEIMTYEEYKEIEENKKLDIFTNCYDERLKNFEDKENYHIAKTQEENHLMTSNLKMAFKFNISKFNSKFVSKPVLDNNDFGMECNDNVNVTNKSSNIIKLEYDLKENRYIIKNASDLNEFSKNYYDEYHNIGDFLDVRYAEDFNHDIYTIKNSYLGMEMFKMINGKKNTIKIFSA